MTFYYGPATVRVGLTLRKSEGEVMNAVKSYIISSKGDESASSYLAVFKERDGGKGYLTRDDLASFLRDADACAPKSSSFSDIMKGPNCEATADKVIAAMDTTGDGNVSWEEFRDKIGLEPIPYNVSEPDDDSTPGGMATSVYDKYSGFKKSNVVDSRIENLYLPDRKNITTKSSKASIPGAESGSSDGFQWTPTKIGLAVGIPLVLYFALRK